MSPSPSPSTVAEIVLASSSKTRAALLRAAGVPTIVAPARIDEVMIRSALMADSVSPRDQADALAEMKAQRTAARFPDQIVVGCDQILSFEKEVLGKPESLDAAKAQLESLRARTHDLYSAVVIYDKAKPVWRCLGEARLTMRPFSDAYLSGYLERNKGKILGSAGGYRLEEEGARLFSRIEGDYFTILGLPLLPVLDYLGQRGWIET